MSRKPLVIIPAAGYANRLRPISKSVSNAMIPVNGKPMISYIIDELKNLKDIYKIVIIVNEYGDVENFIRNSYNGDLPIEFIIQEDRKGPLDAIRIGFEGADIEKHKVSSTIVWLGDTIFIPKENHHLELITKNDLFIVSDVKDYRRWCLYDESTGVLFDKPSKNPKTSKALIGIYTFTDIQRFEYAMYKGIEEPTLNGGYQISSLINWYQKNAPRMTPVQTNNEWYDCGELQSYYNSRSRLLNKSARSFNNIHIDTFYNTVTKTSKEKGEKIAEEKNWFNFIYGRENFSDIQNFIPKVFNSEEQELKMSLEPGTPLNEVWLYDNLHADSWITILGKILKVQNEVFRKPYIINSGTFPALIEMFHSKNVKRLKNYKHMPEYDLVYKFVDESGRMLSDVENIQSRKHWSPVFHGDGHIGNIIYEPTTGGIKFIDPRGGFGGEKIGGDIRYDMGKLFHDFYCGYPNILGKQYTENKDGTISIEWQEKRIKEIQKFLFKEIEKYGYDLDQIKRLSIMLIVTCLPFHEDDKKRQEILWKRGITLIKQDFNNGK